MRNLTNYGALIIVAVIYGKITATIINAPKFVRFLIFINKCSFHNIVFIVGRDIHIFTMHKSMKTLELSPMCLCLSSIIFVK